MTGVSQGVPVSGSGFDSPTALGYSVPERAVAMEIRAFDYEALVRPLEDRMMRSVWRIVRDREAAEDALQDALAVIWKKRETVARHPKPEALILRIAVSSACDALRKTRRRLRHETAGLSERLADDSIPSVTKTVEDRDLRTTILAAIGRLPKRQAAAVLLHIVEELPYGEIAEAMACSESTVRVNVLRGRERLARALAKEIPGLGVGRDRQEEGPKEVAS